MPAPEPLTDADACELAERWLVDPTIMIRAVRAASAFTRETGHQVRIISGYRSAAKQRGLKAEGRPTATDERSTHRSCPATGIDVNVGHYTAAMTPRILRVTWGRIVTEQGLRWGGGSRVDSGGVPGDWNHIDGGPRGSTGVLPLPPPGVPSRLTPLPPPTAAGGQPRSGCPPGQFILARTGQCVTRCPPGTTPYRGQCL